MKKLLVCLVIISVSSIKVWAQTHSSKANHSHQGASTHKYITITSQQLEDYPEKYVGKWVRILDGWYDGHYSGNRDMILGRENYDSDEQMMESASGFYEENDKYDTRILNNVTKVLYIRIPIEAHLKFPKAKQGYFTFIGFLQKADVLIAYKCVREN